MKLLIGLWKNLLSYTVYRECHKEVHGISIIVHYPKDKQAQQELAKKVADVHAQTVIEQIKSMAYPLAQKARLIDAVKSYIPK